MRGRRNANHHHRSLSARQAAFMWENYLYPCIFRFKHHYHQTIAATILAWDAEPLDYHSLGIRFLKSVVRGLKILPELGRA